MIKIRLPPSISAGPNYTIILFQTGNNACMNYKDNRSQLGRKCGKGKVLPITGHEGPEGVYIYIYIYILFLYPQHEREWVVNATPRPLYPRERPGTHCIGGWVGPRAGLDGGGKSRLPTGFDTRTVQPVASRYTDWAIPARRECGWGLNISASMNIVCIVVNTQSRKYYIKIKTVRWLMLL